MAAILNDIERPEKKKEREEELHLHPTRCQEPKTGFF